MDIIKFESVFKASGDEYARIVFWNRFLRNPAELILSFIPAVISIVFMCLGYTNTFAMIIYLICFAYPFFVYRQYKSAVAYHLKNRDASEGAACTFTLTEAGVLAEIHDYNIINTYKWDDCTTIYDRVGYYMFFNKSSMLVMLRKADIPEDLKEPVKNYIKSHIDNNKCVMK